MKRLSSTVITSTRIPFKAFYQAPVTDNYSEQSKLTEEQFIDSEKYKALFESISDVIIETDIDGNIININPACLDFFGYSPKEMDGLSLYNFYFETHALDEMLRLVSFSNQVLNFHAKLRTKDNQVKSASINIRNIYGSNGKRRGVDIFIKNNTDNPKAEE